MSCVEVTLLLVLLLLPSLLVLWRTLVPKREEKIDTSSNKADVFDLQALEPYPQHPFNRNEKYNMTMGLQKLDVKNWLTVDKNCPTQHRIRAGLLAAKREKVLQCLPGSEEACIEVLDLVVDYLTNKYPAMYQLVDGDGDKKRIRNRETGEELGLQQPFEDMAPLEIAARLVAEDVNILKQASDGGEHYLYV